VTKAETVLWFWFDTVRDNQEYYEERCQLWFGHDPQLDQDIRSRFLSDYQQAATGRLTDWQTAPRSGLAFILLLDQFSRNIFRGTPQAFATDLLARSAATALLNTRSDQLLRPVERMFVYMPFMHSEAREDQQRSVALFQQLAQERSYFDGALIFARQHQDIIERFGRFPHRNIILGRLSTPEEIQFLAQPDSSF